MVRETNRDLRPLSKPEEDGNNAVWFRPIMFGLLIVGVLWIIVFYISDGKLPIQPLGAFNLLVGFGIILVGFIMMMRWN